MDRQETIAIGLNKGKLTAALPLVASLLAGFVLLICLQPPFRGGGGRAGDVGFLVIPPMMVFLSWLVIKTSVLVFRRSPGLLIDDRGLTINTTFRPTGFIPWTSRASTRKEVRIPVPAEVT